MSDVLKAFTLKKKSDGFMKEYDKDKFLIVIRIKGEYNKFYAFRNEQRYIIYKKSGSDEWEKIGEIFKINNREYNYLLSIYLLSNSLPSHYFAKYNPKYRKYNLYTYYLSSK